MDFRKLTSILALIAFAVTPTAAWGFASRDGASLRPSGDRAVGDSFTLTLAGGEGPNEISITMTADRKEYVVTANGDIEPFAPCVNTSGKTTELRCPATAINGFEVLAESGNDTVTVGKSVTVSTTLDGGPGIDDLTGGANSDRIVGGSGIDKLIGRSGADLLFGGGANDDLLGGSGKDILRGGPGSDQLAGGPGRDDQRQ